MNLVMMPASPALLPELSPGDEAGAHLLQTLREVLQTADPARIELVGSRQQRWKTGLSGSFQAWGAPQVQVGAGNHLPELVQRYVLGELGSRIVGIREELGQPDPAALTLVALDGSAGLTARSPLTLLDAAPAADTWCRDLLAGSGAAQEVDAGWLMDAGILEPQPWLELAQLRPRKSELLAADTTLGVGRYVAAWEM